MMAYTKAEVATQIEQHKANARAKIALEHSTRREAGLPYAFSYGKNYQDDTVVTFICGIQYMITFDKDSREEMLLDDAREHYSLMGCYDRYRTNDLQTHAVFDHLKGMMNFKQVGSSPEGDGILYAKLNNEYAKRIK